MKTVVQLLLSEANSIVVIFKVLTAVTMAVMMFFRVKAPCGLLVTSQRFGEALHGKVGFHQAVSTAP
jgi:hypothetical protein